MISIQICELFYGFNMLKNRKWDRHKKGGLNFTELGFGSAPLGNLYRSILDEEANATLNRAASVRDLSIFET